MFANPIMLAGLGGAMAPVVIHLLSRARHRTVPWGAMMFLEGETQRPAEEIGRWREIGLLLLRMGIVALLAMALARPVAGRLADAAAEPGRITVAIIVDCSASMAHEDGGVSRMSAARSAVLRVLSGLRRGDQVCIFPAGGASRQPSLFTGDLQTVGNRVSDLKPGANAANFSDAINTAIDALEQQPAGEKRLALICDRQAASWASVDDEDALACRGRLRNLGASFTVISVGSDSTENVAIESAAIANPPAVVKNAAQFEIKLHNYGQFDRLGVAVTVRLDEREEQTATVNVPAHAAASVSLPVKFASVGTHVVDIEIHSDAGDVDDRRELLVDVAPPRHVLVVRERPRAGVDYLRAALTPFAVSGRAGADVAEVETVLADQWDEDSLAGRQVLILDDVATLTLNQARSIERFVYDGGGLIVAPGPLSKTSDYNRVFYREETALLPALLRPPINANQPQRIEPASIDTSHPLLHFLSDHTGALPVVIERYFPLTGRSASARVLASLGNGDPLIVESAYGSGRVLLITCGLDGRWSSLPLTNVYLPLMQSAVRYVSGAGMVNQNITAGQEIVATFTDVPRGSNRAIVVRPDGSRENVEAIDLEGRSEVRYADTRQAGIYTIRLGPAGQERAIRFASMPTSEESDLAPLTDERWSQLAGVYGFERVRDVRRMRAAPEPAGDYWLVLIVGVIALMVLELAITSAWWKRQGRRSILAIISSGARRTPARRRAA